MKRKRLFFNVIVILFILCLPLSIYFGSFRSTVFDKDFYKAEFRKYNVYEKFGEDAEKETWGLLEYFKQRNSDELNTDFFNEKEKAHLRDVKPLVQKALLISWISTILLIILTIILFTQPKKDSLTSFTRALFYGSAFTDVLAVLFAVMLARFNNAFDLFHRIFFKVNYLFNPLTDNIILLFPEGFFFDITKKIMINSLIFANIFIIVSVILFLVCKKCCNTNPFRFCFR